MDEQPKILYIEDNAALSQMMGRLLGGKHGYSVTLAATLAAGRESLSGIPPDIILLDNNLPDGAGVDFLRELRQTSSVPVIMVTSLTEAETADAFEAGCNDYLRKPFIVDDLTERIEKILRHGNRDAPENSANAAKPPDD
jgi:two-component system phosphate regulon response regulator OmpR